MKVGLDISQIAHIGGVSVYTNQLAKLLSKRSDIDIKFLYYSLRKPYHGDLPNVTSIKIPPTLAEVLMNKIRVLSVENLLGEVDLFHSSDWVQPKTKAKKVTTYHDVIPLKFPNWSHPKIVAVHRRRLKLVEEEIDKVIAVSNATKADLLEISKIPENKITVIYQGIEEKFGPQDTEKVTQFKKKYNLPENFLLVLGGIGERKNINRIKDASKDYSLVITGETIPWITDEERPLLYCAASALLYPSMYEGFGLPILEAMACGLPVITSNISSMPEVAGDAALFVNPVDVEDIKNKIKMIMKNEQLRNELVAKGFLQSKKFSWENSINEVMQVYKEVLSS